MANFNLNKVILGGRLTADVELKQTQNGVFVTQFNLAVNRNGKDAQTDFLDIVAWRQTAEFISKYFKKGSSICIIGSLQKREYRDKNGSKRYATEVVADEARFVDSKSDSTSDDSPNFADTAPKFEEVQNTDDLPF